jgi:hypothetical protein
VKKLEKFLRFLVNRRIVKKLDNLRRVVNKLETSLRWLIDWRRILKKLEKLLRSKKNCEETGEVSLISCQSEICKKTEEGSLIG